MSYLSMLSALTQKIYRSCISVEKIVVRCEGEAGQGRIFAGALQGSSDVLDTLCVVNHFSFFFSSDDI